MDSEGTIGKQGIRRFYLCVTAFLSGAAIMIIELGGNRILAPWFGNSLYTWTGLIGVIMICLSGGYYLGGFLGDRFPSWTALANLLAAAAVFSVLIPVLQVPLETGMEQADLVWGPVLASACLFALPGILLGAVSPFAVRLISLLSGDKQIGLSAGRIGMLGTLGSVVGTFASGFLLIPHLSLKMIYIATGMMLGILSVLGYLLFGQSRRRRIAPVVFLSFVLAPCVFLAAEMRIPARALVLHDENTFYHRIRVFETEDAMGGVIHTLCLDSTVEGGQYVNSRRLHVEYQEFWELSKVFVPNLQRAVFLGGGAYGMPEALLDAFPTAEVDVVELDPGVIEVGRKFFRVKDYPRLNPIVAEARTYLRRHKACYDLIFGDAYNGVHYIPAHLVTREFFEIVASRLTENGVFIMNTISGLRGERARLIASIVKTLSLVFEEVHVFALHPKSSTLLQNVILVAGNRAFDVPAELKAGAISAGKRKQFQDSYLGEKAVDMSLGMALTDDRNPAEYMVSRARKISRRKVNL